ncbi:MAG: class I SAM-dependent methyltransferase [Candidatus Krumholzibacteria bacterium]
MVANNHQTASADSQESIFRDVASFYDKLVFPSRSAHEEYQTLLPRQPGERVGDFGCGQSLFHEALRNYSPPPTFLDISPNALATIDCGVRICADLRDLPIRDGVYTYVLCIGVVHHLPERNRVFSEIARVLAPNGELVLGVYAPGSFQTRLKRWHDTARIGLIRSFVQATTAFLISARYAMRGTFLTPRAVHQRTTDFLKVPFVHYAQPEEYAAEAELEGLEFIDSQRIASMNVLRFRRVQEGVKENTDAAARTS